VKHSNPDTGGALCCKTSVPELPVGPHGECQTVLFPGASLSLQPQTVTVQATCPAGYGVTNVLHACALTDALGNTIEGFSSITTPDASTAQISCKYVSLAAQVLTLTMSPRTEFVSESLGQVLCCPLE